VLEIHRAAVPTFVLAPHTLSTILTARAVNGELSLLALASSLGAFTAPKNSATTAFHSPARDLV